MYTQCPFCQTLFRISAQQLRVAHGKARCSQCNRIFSALEYFAEKKQETEDWPESRFIRPIDFADEYDLLEEEEDETGPFSTATEQPSKKALEVPDLLSELADSYHEQPNTKPYSPEEEESIEEDFIADRSSLPGTDTHFNNYLAELEKNVSSPSSKSTDSEFEKAFPDPFDIDEETTPDLPLRAEIDSDSADTNTETIIDDQLSELTHEFRPDDDALTPLIEHDETDHEENPPYRLAEDVPEIEPSQEKMLSIDEILAQQRPSKRKRLILGALVLITAMAAALQLTWIKREQLMEIPQVAAYLNRICAVIDCKLPVRRAPEKFEVVDRSLVITPDQPGVLQLNLTFTNNANFPQPHPELSLSLYRSDQELMARRIFKPQEYLSLPVSDHSLIEPRKKIIVSMSLEEPSEEITGFRFDFQ